MVFTMQEPFYGILLSAMERVPTKHCKTIGVGRSGNVFKLYYNPDFLEPLSIDTVLQILKHETLHVAFNHFSLWENNNVSEALHQVRNIAADMEVNGYLDMSVMKDLKPVNAEDFGWELYAGTREYFKRLMQKNKEENEQQAQAKAPQNPCNGGLGGNDDDTQSSSSDTQQSQQQGQGNGQQQQSQNSGQQSAPNSGQSALQDDIDEDEPISQEFLDKCNEVFDDHTQWPDCSDEDIKEQMQQVIDDMLVFAADEVEKGRGTIPGELVGKITDLRKKKPRPVTDWKRYFRRYLGNEFSEFIRKSKKRESRRFPDAAGNRHRRKSHILVAIDTSGSVSMPEYREFFGQIKTLTASATFHVLECDTQIVHEYDFKGRPNETLHGGGGTDFTPPIEFYNAHRKDYDALVYFTDGYAPIPKNTPKETLWVISSNGDHDRKRYKVNGATAVFIKNDN